MIENLRLKNLRLFRDLEIRHLERINLLTGQNNSGKTTVLEALLLLGGGQDPELVLDLPKVRGVGQLPAESQATFWNPLFFDLNHDAAIEIKVEHSALRDVALSISRQQSDTFSRRSIRRSEARGQGERSKVLFQSVPYAPRRGLLGRTWEIELAWTASDTDGLRRMHLSPDGSNVDFSGKGIPLSAAFVSPTVGNAEQDAMLFSQLRARKQGQLLTEALRTIEPRLERIEETSTSGTPMIWADVGLAELAPLSALGEGITRVTRIVLAMTSVPGGVVLLDEIETGLHHSAITELCEVVDSTARMFDVQVFATTQSYECMMATQESLADEWRFHRLERSSEGESRCVTLDPDDMEVVVRQGWEAR